MTVQELYEELSEMVQDGKGYAKVYFDTEAQHYHEHWVPVDFVCWEDPEITGLESLIVLSEDAPHRSGC